ncbi:MAG TPA: VOC family protein [Pedococcus sp.]|jgi:predicted enzyme related to lactoylglutathione lyase|nr:VOC family protein [Pedococcus sp.]
MSDNTSMLTPVLDLVVLDCPDPEALAGFYSTILGWPLEEDSSAEWVTLRPPGDAGERGRPVGRITLAFQRVEGYQAPTWPQGPRPQHFHLDFTVSDIDAAEPAVLGAGASVHEHQPSETGSFRVYLDPAGHPFCLCKG